MSFLLFTSAGNKCIMLNNDYWLSHINEKLFDIFICFYGTNDDVKNKLKQKCEYFVESKGGKFENLLKVYQTQKNTLLKYDYIFVIDDDILINTLQINFLFKCIKQLNCSIIQPSLIDDKNCRIDHPCTKQRKDVFAHKSNFIEMNVPLFKSIDLFSFLDYLIALNEPILKGAGMDFMYCHYLSSKNEDSFGDFYIVDVIGCINPKNEEQDREICKLQSTSERFKHWDYLQGKYRIYLKKIILDPYINECPEELVADLSRLPKIKSNLSN